MVKFEWMCNICKRIFPDTRQLMLHVFFDHSEAIHYGTPIAVDKLPIPKRPEPVAAKIMKAVKPRIKRTPIEEPEEELEEEELDEEEDLSLD